MRMTSPPKLSRISEGLLHLFTLSSTTLSIVQNIQRSILGLFMNLKGSERKRSWANLCYCGVFSQSRNCGARKTAVARLRPHATIQELS
jgi:hypothetical protein